MIVFCRNQPGGYNNDACCISNYFIFKKRRLFAVMADWVWVNFKQMLCDVLGSRDSELIALNSVLVIPMLIDEIDSLRLEANGGSAACARKHGGHDLAVEQMREAREVCGEMLRA